jgi:hypothetical protein
MLSTVDLLKLKVHALDGDVGSVRDVLFSDEDWTVRHLVIDTGSWIFGRHVLIDPEAISDPEALSGALELDLTRDEVKALPDAPTDPMHGPNADSVGGILQLRVSDAVSNAPDLMLLGGGGETPSVAVALPDADSGHMHSLREVAGYDVCCGADSAGKLAGFLIDPVAWDLPLALIEAPENTLLLPTRLIDALNEAEHAVLVAVDAATLADAPVYDSRLQDERVYLPVVTDYYASRSPAA